VIAMTRLLTLALAAALLAGCGGVGFGTTPAMLFSQTRNPVAYKRATPPGTPLQIPGDLALGKATTYKVGADFPGVPGGRLWTVGWGDMSMERALANGGLAEATYVDAYNLRILGGVFEKATLEVRGPALGTEPAAAAPPPEPPAGP
jgi:hypothetical protein